MIQNKMSDLPRGFTLIETLIYMGLMTIIMGGGIAAAFYLMDTAEKNRTTLNAEVESEFFLRKIDWALTGATSISAGSTLAVTKGGESYFFEVSSGRGRVTYDFATRDLTGDRVTLSNETFTHTPAAGGRPASVAVSFDANGKTYSFIKYVRQ